MAALDPASPLRAEAHEHEAVGLRTADSRTYVGDVDGSRRIVVGAEPINVYRDGRWTETDTTLESSGAGFSPRAIKPDLELPRTADGDVVVSSGDAQLRFRVIGASGAATTTGATATYADAVDGSDMRWTATSDGVKEAITFAGANAVHPVTYRMSWSGVTPQRKDGRVVFIDAAGQVKFTIGDLFLVDSAKPQHFSGALPVKFDSTGGSGTLTVTPPKSYLHQPGLKWPVTLDPTISAGTATASCTRANVTDPVYDGPGYNTLPNNSSDSVSCGGPLYVGTSQQVTDLGGRDNDCAPVYGARSAYTSMLRFNVSGLDPYSEILNASLVYHGVGLTSVAQATNTTWDGGESLTMSGQPYTEGGLQKINLTYRNPTTGAPENTIQKWINTGPNFGLVLHRDTITGAGSPEDCQVDPYDDSGQISDPSDSTPANRPYLEIRVAPMIGARPYYAQDSQSLSDAASLSVNAASGNLMINQGDASLPGGLGPAVGFGHSYNSLSEDIGALGTGWNFDGAPDIHLEFPQGSAGVILHDAADTLVPIAPGSASSGNDQYVEPDWLGAQLTKSSGTYTLTDNASQTQQQFDSSGRLTAIQDRNGRRVEYTYSSGQLASIKDASGRYLQVTYSGSKISAITQLQNPKAAASGTNTAYRTWQYAYDSSGRLSTYTDPESGQYQYGYDSSNRLNSITDPRGHLTLISYDSAGKVATVKRVTGGSPGSYTGPVHSYTYNTNQTTTAHDPNGHDSTFVFGNQGEYKQAQDQRGRTRTQGYTTGLMVNTYKPPGASGVTQTLTYSSDGLNNIEKLVSSPGGSVSDFNTSAKYGTASGVGSGVAGVNYKAGCVIDPAGHATTFAYDSAGNPTTTTARSGTGATSCTSNPTLFASTVAGYDTAPDGKGGRLVTITDGNGNMTHYGYDADGNLTTITPPTITTVTNVTQPGITSLTYDNYGRIHTRTNGRGETTTYTYDKRNRLTKLEHGTDSVQYAYDGNSNLTSRVDPVGTSTYTYDNLNHLTQQNEPGSRTTSYTYDANGNLATLTDGGGEIDYAYWDDNQVHTVQEYGVTGTTTEFQYDPSTGYPSDENLPNGISVHTTYDQLGRMLTLKADHGNPASPFINTTYAYIGDRLDNDNGTVGQYTYDALNRLSGAGSATFAADAAGNIKPFTGSPATFNQFNELTSLNSGANTFGYDANGNLTSRGVGSGTPALSAASDAYNWLDQTTSINSTSMSYLGAGQDELISDGSASLQYNALGMSRYSTTGADTYITRTDTGQPVSQRTPSGRQFYVTDRQGNVIALANASGTVLTAPTYDTWGNATNTGGLGSGSSRSYLGWEGGYLTSAGLYHFGQRFYDPGMRRWTQPDPVDQAGDLLQGNRYAYASGDPVNQADPFGLFTGTANIAKCNGLSPHDCEKHGIDISLDDLKDAAEKIVGCYKGGSEGAEAGSAIPGVGTALGGIGGCAAGAAGVPLGDPSTYGQPG